MADISVPSANLANRGLPATGVAQTGNFHSGWRPEDDSGRADAADGERGSARRRGHVPDGCLAGAFAAALDRLTEGVLFVDAKARIVFANTAAEALIRGRRGLCADDGVLRAEVRGDTLALHRLIASSARNEKREPARYLVISSAEGTPLSVIVAPPAPDALQELPTLVTIFIANPERLQPPSIWHLRRHFGLTEAEAAFAREVLTGDGIEACSRRLGISTGTARTHLHRVFQKTGTKRQAELVRVLLGLSLPILESQTPWRGQD